MRVAAFLCQPFATHRLWSTRWGLGPTWWLFFPNCSNHWHARFRFGVYSDRFLFVVHPVEFEKTRWNSVVAKNENICDWSEVHLTNHSTNVFF